ncbi:MAG: DUF2807 domain-containing protein, partial [Bacteroidetes bacterium]|nr:DUF2807 domain-containing protein [Bacteroidota bacterium]
MRLSLYSLLALLLLVGYATPSFAQRSQTIDGSGSPGSRSVEARGVHEISLSVPGTLVIEVGREAPLRIEGDDNIVDAIIVERDGDELKIRAPRRTSLRPNRPLRLYVGVASLQAVSVAGSGQIEAEGIRAGSFEASVAGSGSIVIGGLDANSVQVSVAGSGDVVMDGRADELEISIAGSGNAHLAFVGLRFEPYLRAVDEQPLGVRWLGAGSDILFEDCYVAGYATNFVFQASNGSFASNVRFRRCVVVDAWSTT